MDYKTANCDLKQLESEFLELVIQDVGKGQFNEDQFEEIKPQQKPAEEEDFQFQEEEQQQSKQQRFKKSIALGPQKRPPINKNPPQLDIGKYSFVYGFNSGNRTVTIIEGKICRAVGVNIFFQGNVFFGHNFKIIFLSYDYKKKLLISGTGGKCPEIIIWTFQNTESGPMLTPFYQQEQKQLMYLPLSSLGVASAYLVRDDTLAVITKFNLHQNSNLYIFDLKTQKRVHSDIKLEKMIDVINCEPALLLTTQGLSELSINEDVNCSINKITPQESMLTAFQVLQQSLPYYLVGTLNGKIKLIKKQSKAQQTQIKSHLTYVICIRLISKTLFASSGGDKCLIIHNIAPNYQITKIKTIQLSAACLNILVTPTTLYCPLKTGQILQIQYQANGNAKPKDYPINSRIVYHNSSKTQITQHFAYNRFANKYFYGCSDNKQMSILTIDQKSNITNSKKITLKYEPAHFDIIGNIAAYVHQQHKPTQKLSNKSHIHNNLIKGKETHPCIIYLILQDYTIPKVMSELQLPQQSPCTMLKLNHSGNKLALGFHSGKISIFDVNKPTQITLISQSTAHDTPIIDLIWSEDSKFLKTITKNNLLYFDLQKPTPELSPVFSSKSLKQADWISVGKFDWRNFYVWQNHANHVDDITNIIKTQQYQLACMENGNLNIYRNPAGKQHQELARFFTCKFDCHIINDQDTRFTAVITSQGMLFAIPIGQDLTEGEEGAEVN